VLFRSGLQEGHNQGMQQERVAIAKNLLNSKLFEQGVLSYDHIAQSCKLKLEEVKALHRNMIRPEDS